MLLPRPIPYRELIVVDDGSTDDSRRKVETLAAADARVRYIYQENGPARQGRNAGIAMARGGLVVFDQMTCGYPRCWSNNALLDSSKADLVLVISITWIRKAVTRRNGRTRLRQPRGKEGFIRLLKLNYIPIFTVLAQKQRILDAGCFRESTALQLGKTLTCG